MKKYNLILPIAGDAQRFKDAGYSVPKPMIPCAGKTILEVSLSQFDLSEANIVFIVQKNHVLDFSIDQFLYNKFGKDINIITLDKKTDGAARTCAMAFHHGNIINDIPLVIYTPDVYFEGGFNLSDYKKHDGAVLTFKANSADHSYAETKKGRIVNVKEKQVISDNALVGLYYYKDPQSFFRAAETMFTMEDKFNNEYYISLTYNYLIDDGLDLAAFPCTKLYVLGTPKELEFYESNVFDKWRGDFKIGLCSDHSGFASKEATKILLANANVEYIDYGCFSDKDCDYTVYVNLAAKEMKKGSVNNVFAFCKTGQGVNICANKIDGVRSSLIYDDDSCRYAIEHNCANIFCFPEKIFNAQKMAEHIKKVKNLSFDGGRHYNRINSL